MYALVSVVVLTNRKVQKHIKMYYFSLIPQIRNEIFIKLTRYLLINNKYKTHCFVNKTKNNRGIEYKHDRKD